jgi:hypothetical protein
VAAEDVKATWARTLVTINRAVMGIPSRVKSDWPEIDAAVMSAITVACRDALRSAAAEMASEGE